MNKKIFFCEWTEFELLDKNYCFCDCHTHPGTYLTDENNPCYVCGHANECGYFPRFVNNGWVEYWRSDRVRVDGNQERV